MPDDAPALISYLADGERWIKVGVMTFARLKMRGEVGAGTLVRATVLESAQPAALHSATRNLFTHEDRAAVGPAEESDEADAQEQTAQCEADPADTVKSAPKAVQSVDVGTNSSTEAEASKDGEAAPPSPVSADEPEKRLSVPEIADDPEIQQGPAATPGFRASEARGESVQPGETSTGAATGVVDFNLLSSNRIDTLRNRLRERHWRTYAGVAGASVAVLALVSALGVFGDSNPDPAPVAQPDSGDVLEETPFYLASEQPFYTAASRMASRLRDLQRGRDAIREAAV